MSSSNKRLLSHAIFLEMGFELLAGGKASLTTCSADGAGVGPVSSSKTVCGAPVSDGVLPAAGSGKGGD